MRYGRHNTDHGGQKTRTGCYIRNAGREEFGEDASGPVRLWRPSGRTRMRLWVMSDPDLGEYCSNHSTGWKENKYRFQWEHRIRMDEKRRRNRRIKQLHRGKRRR